MMAWYFVPLLIAFWGCSLQKMAIKSSTPIFEQTAFDFMKEGHWDFFKETHPPNLKMVELTWMQDKENLKLLSVLIKGYAGYAFTVPETLYFGDELAGIENSPWKKESITFYTRAFDYGLHYLNKKGINHHDLLSSDEKALPQKLEDLDEDDMFALLYTAQSWGSLINLQKDNISLVAQIPKVKLLFDHVCKIRPDIDQNVCDIFYAQYESSRPKMLGGNPENAEKLYLAAIKKYPQHLLIRLNYIQYLLIPAFEQEKYEEQAKVLKEEFSKLEDLNRDTLENLSPYKNAQELNLYNSIAKKRFELIEKYKSKIF
jgi:hypothetical protein